MSATKLGVAVVCWLAAAGGICGPIHAAEKQPRYPERMVYDPATDTWVQAPSPVPGTEQGELELGLIEIAEGQPAKAKARLKKWLKQYPNSDRRPDAMIALADAELALGNHMQAYRQYEKVLEQYPGMEGEETILRHEFAIGVAFLSGVKQKVWILRLPAHEEGIDILDRVSTRVPGATLAEDAIKAKADYYYRTGQFGLAEVEYARLAQEFPRGRYPRLALLQSALSAMARFPGVAFDDAALLEARERFVAFKDRYPEFAEHENVDAFIRRIDETRAAKHLMIGKWYGRQKRPQAAAVYYRGVIERWPDASAAVEARERLAAAGEVKPESGTQMLAPASEPEVPATQG